MRNKTTKFLAVTCASLSLLSMVACKSNQSTSSTAGNKPAVDVDFEIPEGGFDTSKEVKITFYHTMGQALQDVFNIYLEKFNKEYPNIIVNHQSIGSYDDIEDQTVKEISAGTTAADLVYCYPDHIAMYNKSKKIINLNNLIVDSTYGLTEEQENDFVEAYYQEGMAFGDGRNYCLPFSKSTEVMYYNKTFFDEHNLQVPTTWDEMEAVCKQIKEIDPQSIPLGYDSDSNLFITMLEQNGYDYTSAIGNHFLFNNDGAKSILKKIKEWKDKDLFTTKSAYGTYTSSLFTETNADATKSYICIGSSGGASYQESQNFEAAVAPIPQVNKNNPKVIQQGPDIALIKNGDPQKIMASWLLLRYFATNTEFQCQFSLVSGYSPVIKSAFANEKYKAQIEKGRSLQTKVLKLTETMNDSYFTSPAFVGSSEARTQAATVVKSVLLSTTHYNDIKLDGVINKALETAVKECENSIK